jgi:hypothetical protein
MCYTFTASIKYWAWYFLFSTGLHRCCQIACKVWFSKWERGCILFACTIFLGFYLNWLKFDGIKETLCIFFYSINRNITMISTCMNELI